MRVIECRAVTPDSTPTVLVYVRRQGILREHVPHYREPIHGNVLLLRSDEAPDAARH